MKQRLLQLNLFLSEWKGRLSLLCLSLSLLGGLTMPSGRDACLTRSHCERITIRSLEAIVKTKPSTFRLPRIPFGTIRNLARLAAAPPHPVCSRQSAETIKKSSVLNHAPLSTAPRTLPRGRGAEQIKGKNPSGSPKTRTGPTPNTNAKFKCTLYHFRRKV
ncbi:hypothetical protein EVAR_66035_1 [Eumeta japonica]|uniref:Uncharacterized protein n=1 Tax=Eumeta variegata TaxID=151549 RepID=A0A4C1Z8Q9_EUMVA|nr:hypothetical protein EVAR_66035_1 [Eumeta japonica]